MYLKDIGKDKRKFWFDTRRIGKVYLRNSENFQEVLKFQASNEFSAFFLR